MIRQRAFVFAALLLSLAFPGAKVVAFSSGNITLQGVLYQPTGAGPFPALVFNHGSAPGMYSNDAIEALGPLFAKQGWCSSRLIDEDRDLATQPGRTSVTKSLRP
jgi:hypothetical protein